MSLKESLSEQSFVVGEGQLRSGEIPSLVVCGENLPGAWESSVLVTLKHGVGIPTEYDQEIDPESKDATAMIIVTNPSAEPRIHRALPCGLDELYIYTQEVVKGVHDHWVGEKGWSYSYHDRLKNWPGNDNWIDLPHVDQIDTLTKKLAVAPHSRRAQAITWYPPADSVHHEPPCLQRIWCRVVKSDQSLYLLEMNTHWRSRDAFKAAFMNMFALTTLQASIARKISNLSGKRVEAGRYVDISDSYHLYGSYLRKGELDHFLELLEKRGFEKRTWATNDPVVQREFTEGRKKLEQE